MRPVLGWFVLAAVAGSVSACGSDGPTGKTVVAAASASSDPAVSVTSSGPVVAPPGTRLVGLSHAAIAVPMEWGTNQTHCGVPKEDTVVIDVGAIPACGTGRPHGVESVEIWQGPPRFDDEPGETIEVDGVPAERHATTCNRATGRLLCGGGIVIPSLDASFWASSSTSAAEVDRILGWVRIAPDRVGVPGFQAISLNEQGGAQTKYLDALQQAGLTAEIHTRKVPAVHAGIVLDVSPAPGTMVQPGDVVTVTVVAEPEGPADEVRVGMNSADANDEYHGLTDEQIRAGAAIELDVGDRIWAYAMGKRSSTLAGELDGASLTIDDWKEVPNYPHAWRAVSAGTTRITLTITADGRHVTIGTVTVEVK